ncbi:MAG: chromosomal replication initiator protein DnaA [Alphaproteobacteria bacterium]|nr:chromosomal replication initiator protein DnaA [Alphaproteobacteria bacterium]MBV9151725.1 chromosomal replication initiator protein DnaA [Alphaproteobacteria bacterium]MBV9584225.1 chromosomal replication initiator protein DnaA [Alphaproteobacteria bacterium]MBV9964498.1 chromosomal replication initiator protein DnaA [Alphaproteobacteria bacterium]
MTGAGEWSRVVSRLKEEVGETAYRSWLKSMRLERLEGGEGVIAVPTRFLRNWVATHYADRLLALWRTENEQVRRLAIIVEPRVAAFAQPKDAEVAEAAPAALVEPVGAPDIGDVPASLSAPLDPRFTFENFIVGKPNELAHAAARRVAEACVSPVHTVPFNPLFLYGGVGLGKTHLMHAIAWHVRNQAPSRKVIYLSAEKFMYQFIRALRFRSTMDFKDQFRSVDLLMIDDVQFISGKDSTQEEFFHTFNALVDQNRQIVISADKSPSDLAGLEERMRSRLGWGLVADIHPTTYELRLGILQSKAEQSGSRLPQKILEFLAHKIVSNVRELEGALNRIIAQMQLVGREITLESAQDLLHDLLRANERRVTIDEIQRRVAEHFNIKMAEMTSSRRARVVARPRQVAMYLAKQLTSRSLPEIGRKFGGRDHTTVIHAVKKIEELIESDSALAEDVELLRRMLQS